MYTIRFFLTAALVFLALCLPSAADTTCTKDNQCSNTIGSSRTCHNGGCYYEQGTCATGYRSSSDCFQGGFLDLFTFCKCQKISTGSNYRRRRDLDTCAPQQERCPIYHGRGGSECVDTLSDIESCGGCVGLDGSGPGKDCTNIPGAESVSCVNGSCVIDECATGYKLDAEHSTCKPIAGMRIQSPLKRSWRMD